MKLDWAQLTSVISTLMELLSSEDVSSTLQMKFKADAPGDPTIANYVKVQDVTRQRLRRMAGVMIAMAQ